MARIAVPPLSLDTVRAGRIDDNSTKGRCICAAQVIRLLPPHTRVALLTVGSCVCVYRVASDGPVVADVMPASGPSPPALGQRLQAGAGCHLGPLSSSMAPLQQALETLRWAQILAEPARPRDNCQVYI